MKTKIGKSLYGLEITLEPETIEEQNTLLQYGINAKMEKPMVTYGFSNNPYLRLWLRKVNPKVQKTSFFDGK